MARAATAGVACLLPRRDGEVARARSQLTEQGALPMIIVGIMIVVATTTTVDQPGIGIIIMLIMTTTTISTMSTIRISSSTKIGIGSW